MITIVDYGLGNVRAFENIYRRLGIPIQSAKSANELVTATKLILPGVGAFDWAVQRLDDSGMREQLNELVLEKKIPVLGVCVGMQIMARASEEGKKSGLGWIDAEVKGFDASCFYQKMPIPHMGWNKVSVCNNCRLFDGIDDCKYYFLHSYYLEPRDAQVTVGLTSYGKDFTSAIAHENIYATQFHPEKSHQWGIKLLSNFAGIC